MVKDGYKQTEVGVIPVDWEVKVFTEITDLITCGIAARPKYVAPPSGFPFLSSTNVKDGTVIWDNYKHIDDDTHSYLYKNNPPERGDILYSRVGTIGHAAVIDVDFEFSIYVSLTLIKPSKTIDSYFLAHLLNSKPYRSRANGQVYLGGGVGNLNVSVVRGYPIPLPTLREQRAIASALSDTDALLSALDALIGKKEAFKRGMMEGLLSGERRLEGFSSAAASGGEGAWEETTFGDCFDIYGTASFSRANMEADGDVGCVHYGDIHTKFGTHFNGKEEILPMITETQAGSYRRIKNGDLVFSDASEDYDGIGQMVEFYNMDNVNAIGGLHTYLLSPRENLFAPHFAGYLSQNPKVKSQMIEKSTGTTVYGISKDNLRSVELSLPPLPEQRAIARVLSDLDAELSALRARRAKLAKVKAGMMEVLLTGAVRLV